MSGSLMIVMNLLATAIMLISLVVMFAFSAGLGPAAAEYSWREKIIHSEIDWHTMNLRGGDAFSKYNVFFLPLYVNISLLWCRIMRFASFRLIGYIWSLYSQTNGR